MKYLMFEDTVGHPLPILFPNRIEHEEMREQIPYGRVLSGGFVDLEGGRLRCHGEAAELHVKADPGDAAILEQHFLSNGAS